MLYSPYRQACYCFLCFLFSKKQLSSKFSKEEGFSTWRKFNPPIKNHETSPSHTVCMREYFNLVVQLQRSATIDAHLQKQAFAEKQKQKAITFFCHIYPPFTRKRIESLILDRTSALAWELPFPRCLCHLSSI